ncbi:MAG: metal-dependent hydrolase [Rhodothermales bacterium]
MDSLTQLALGAAIGEATLGKREGNKAILWGAIIGTVPDLDIMLYPFIDEVQELAVHRGLSHSIFFAVGFSLLLGRLLVSVYGGKRTSWLAWAWMSFLALLTHALLDSFTHYGTQLFQPFSNYPVAFNTISIIDPLYTVPLLVGVVGALFLKRRDPRRQWLNRAGLLLSTAYLALTVVNKAHVTSRFSEALDQQYGGFERLTTNPSLFNNLLWTGIAERADTLLVGTYSLLDDAGPIRFEALPKRTGLIAPYLGDTPVQRLLWFSRGYFTVDSLAGGQLAFRDVRFPRSDLWLDQGGDYLFSFDLVLNPDATAVTTFHATGVSPKVTAELWHRYVRRILGDR